MSSNLYADILGKIPNIISHLKFHSPDRTSSEEKAVIEHATLEIENCGENNYGLNFHLADYLFHQIEEKLPFIESSLLIKAQPVFKYFDNASVVYVKVKPKSN